MLGILEFAPRRPGTWAMVQAHIMSKWRYRFDWLEHHTKEQT